MGNTIWVEVHGRPLRETAEDFSIMGRLMDKLDALAHRMRVTKLSEFFDYSELEASSGEFDMGGEVDEDKPLEERSLEERQAAGEWFDSGDGLRSVQTLKKHLSEHFGHLRFTPNRSTDHWPKRLMDELATAEGILRDAATRGWRFRLVIVP